MKRSYTNKDTNFKLRQTYTKLLGHVIADSTWRNTLLKIRKSTDAEPGTEEFNRALWFYAKNIKMQKMLGGNYKAKANTLNKIIAKLIDETPGTDAKSYLQNLAKSLKVVLPRSTAYNMLKGVHNRNVFDEESRFVLAYRICFWQLNKQKQLPGTVGTPTQE
jgi:hypothetical protein